MAVSTQSALEDIERRRVQLQQNVDQLRKALSHWTTWEAEYEALKEEIEAADDASPSQIREIARGLELTLLNEKEVQELISKNSPSERRANQVVDMISRRIDYVRTSSATIEKNLDAAEKKLAGVDVLLEPGMDNEDGEPMMDIEEELDDEGNEVSSSVNQTGKAAAELVEVLRKAGIQKVELEKRNATQPQEESLKKTSDTAPVSETVPTPSSSKSIPTRSDDPVPKPSPLKKTVSFAEDVEVESSQSSDDDDDGEEVDDEIEDEKLATLLFPKGARAVELNESPEDAEMRSQMLQYAMSEAGQVVAELNLDHPTAEYSDDETDGGYSEYDTEDEEDEDEYGRSTRPVITEEYRRKMMELERKLGARMMENVGPQTDEPSLEEHMGDIRTMVVKEDDEFDGPLYTSKSEAPSADSQKKGVRFAEDLDISNAAKQVQAPPPATKPVPTMSDTVIERAALGTPVPVEPPKPGKVSRFKSARAGATPPSKVLPTPPIPEAPPVPSGPQGKTLADTVTEHAPLPSEPQAPDEFDPILVSREIQAHYNKARNRFIAQQGGFKATEEDEENPIVEERDGKTKKVSRFMAARLKAEGM
ncbi:udp-galactose transporter like [Pyrenophora seminiperda CCB06]|uniref:Udp-galactose transporter like n=1 Tax=Pyrenophora seminiperda CCB06 TaxID=1302712 RepID=A0A3M7M1P1_9PLEO|nr:udp-galactose transporter like [Pyrenophora seminiperda CCB06]